MLCDDCYGFGFSEALLVVHYRKSAVPSESKAASLMVTGDMTLINMYHEQRKPGQWPANKASGSMYTYMFMKIFDDRS